MIVYRLQDKAGNGPFYGDEQPCIKYLTYHKDPDDMIGDIGITKNELWKLFSDGWLFAWKDENLIQGFVKHSKWPDVLALGFEVVELSVKECVVFPDGQVMFKPDVKTCS